MPKRDMSFSVFFDPHFSQATSGFDPKTSFSKSVLQALQWYSYIGITIFKPSYHRDAEKTYS